MGNYVLSERDYQRVQTMLRWYEREKNLRNKYRRRNLTVGGGVRNKRRAKIQGGGVPSDDPPDPDTHFTCKLLDKEGNETGDTIDVYPCTHLGSNPYDGDIWPDLSANDVISIFKDLDGKWYIDGCIFDDVAECS